MKRVKKKRKRNHNSLTISASIILPTGDGSSAHVNNFRFPRSRNQRTISLHVKINRGRKKAEEGTGAKKEVVAKNKIKIICPRWRASFVQVQRN